MAINELLFVPLAKTSETPNTMTKPLHQIIARQIDQSGLTQREIAAAIGYDKPNVIAMMKQGTMRIPINKIPALADVLGMDRVDLLRTALAEYQPEVLETINEMIRSVVTENERRLLVELRKLVGGPVPPLATAKQRDQLKELASELVSGTPNTPSSNRPWGKPLTPPPEGEDFSDPSPKLDAPHPPRPSRRNR